MLLAATGEGHVLIGQQRPPWLGPLERATGRA